MYLSLGNLVSFVRLSILFSFCETELVTFDDRPTTASSVPSSTNLVLCLLALSSLCTLSFHLETQIDADLCEVASRVRLSTCLVSRKAIAKESLFAAPTETS
jgi:hypothetical protein